MRKKEKKKEEGEKRGIIRRGGYKGSISGCCFYLVFHSNKPYLRYLTNAITYMLIASTAAAAAASTLLIKRLALALFFVSSLSLSLSHTKKAPPSRTTAPPNPSFGAEERNYKK
jgi:hypothetical protein